MIIDQFNGIEICLDFFLILSLSHKIRFNNAMPMADFADGKSVVFIGTGLKTPWVFS